jgi:predicted MPP superfamily phosphohydrolase
MQQRVHQLVTSRWASRILATLLVLLAALGGYATLIEPARLTVHRAELEVPHWPKALSGAKVALLSDLHIGSPFWDLSRLRELVTRVNAEQPDIVLLAGDYLINDIIGGHFVAIEPIADELAKLHAPWGVVAVLGNHDWWNDGAHVRSVLEQRGIRVLDDETLRIDARGSSFVVLGLADIEVRHRTPQEELALAPAGAPLLVLVHEPDVFARLDARASLTLAGHTHGGQVCLPLLGRLIVPSAFGQRYAAGQIVENGRHLFVTTGLGTSILPVRFGVVPEIALLSLRAPSSDR